MEKGNSALRGRNKIALPILFVSVLLSIVGAVFGGENAYLFFIASTVLSLLAALVFVVANKSNSKILLVLLIVFVVALLLGLGVQWILVK